ncbi:MAG: peptidoglycan bridge formation glycyltransferase FemA/FemB family protein [Angelakisella sp.]
MELSETQKQTLTSELLDFNNQQACTEYEDFVKNHRAGSFMQSLRWCKVKNTWGHEALLVRRAGKVIGTMLILVKKVPLLHTSLLYAPRGPVCDLHDREVVAALLDAARGLSKKHHAYLLRIDPYVLAEDDAFIKMAQGLGLRFVPDMGDFTTIQTRNNYMLDIEHKTADEVFANFHSKWRYNIRLAAKNGVECRVCTKESIDDFYQLMVTTGKRDAFIVRPKEYFVKMLDALGEHCRLFLCYHEGKAVSGAVTTQYAGKTCYVYGASSNEARNVMPNHLMQWTMIQWAIENGDFLYDFQGIPYYQDETNPHYGVYRFKKGFNGQVVSFAGEFDFVFSSTMERLVGLGDRTIKGIRTVQRSLRKRVVE